MSDDEMAGGAPDDFGGDDDMSDDGGMGGYKPPPELPEGITKEILTPAPSDSWKKPKAGDDVEVHYVGTLESDGSEFDSSRSRGKPFTFALGKGQVIDGWDKGVATMKKGEIAKFTLSPEFAYGDDGSPPKIPAKATLVFEVELLGWTSKDDLFGDEGVIKSTNKEGSGWKQPKDGDEVKLSLKVTCGETVKEEKADFEYAVGSGVFGPLSKALDKALAGMKKDEEASLKCTKDYAYGDEKPEGAVIDITLIEIFETKDVSFTKNKDVMKKQVKAGDGYDTPKDSTKVTLAVESTNAAATTIDFTCGNGDVCDAVEAAVLDMKKGERAVVTCTTAELAADAKLGLPWVTTSSGSKTITLELQEFEKPKDTWNMSEEEKVEFAESRKDVGATLFKGGRVALAYERYKKVSDLFNYIDNFKEENKEKAKALKKACELNKAACALKLKDFADAKKACNEILKNDGENAKGLYRRAQADFGLKNFDDCRRDLKKLLDADSQNKDARALLKQTQAAQKEEDKKSKGLFQNMCKALGKGPIPPPGKTKDPMAGMDDDEEDMDMPPPAASDDAQAAEEKTDEKTAE